jgi:phosphate transport system substrate-binding protein
MALGVIAALAAGTVGLAGCRNSTSGTTGTDASSTAGSTKPGLAGAITVAGSDTMVNLAQAWAEEFMKENSGVQIAVKGGGSGTGIAALLNGTVDFADASREMKPEEISQLKAKGGDAVQTVVARDGITVIVNPSNVVVDISKDNLGRIYRGEITNWKAVGGPDKPITIVSRDPSSGTYELFKEKVVGKDKNYAKSAKLLPSTQAVVDEVKANADAIGYIGVGYESAGVKAVTLDGKAASKATVLDGSYELARTLNMYSSGAPKDVMKAYVDWILSDAGQKIVADQGFVTVK